MLSRTVGMSCGLFRAGSIFPWIRCPSNKTGWSSETAILSKVLRKTLFARRAWRYWSGLWFFSAYPRKSPDEYLEWQDASVSRKLSLWRSRVLHKIFMPMVDSTVVVCFPVSSVCRKLNLTCFLAVTSKRGRVLLSKSNSLMPSVNDLISSSVITVK